MSTRNHLYRCLELAPEVLRWRGALRFALITVRELVRPVVLVRAIYVLETDLRYPVADAPPPPEVELRILTSSRVDELHRLAATDAITVDVARQRLARGDHVVMACTATESVGFTWIGCASRWQSELRATMRIGPNEVNHYDSYVKPAWRGKGLHSALIARGKRHARDNGYERTVSWIAALNNPSLKVLNLSTTRCKAALFVRPITSAESWIIADPAVRARFA